MSITQAQIIQWLQLSAETLSEKKDYLTNLDREIGDGDHGLNMVRGFNKVVEKLATVGDASIADIFKTTGMTLLSSVGGASGPLYGTFFIKAAQAIGDKNQLMLADFTDIFQAGTKGIISRGHAEKGDKTLCDVWLTVCEWLKDNDTQSELAQALAHIAALAEQSAEDTAPLQAKKGRASYLNERSIGHIDPGAASSALLLKTLAEVING